MSFRKEYPKEQAREVKQIKKLLPFTVRDIGNGKDLEEWKRIQAEKEAIWEAGRAERYAAARQRAIDVITGVTTPKQTANDAADARFQIMDQDERHIQKIRKELASLKESTGAEVVSTPKLSLWDRILNFFTSINFEPKTK